MPSSLKSFTSKRRIRRSFSKIKKIIEMPNLIEVQRESYKSFLQMYIEPSHRSDIGLEAVFRSVFPINDFAGRANLNYVSYKLEKPVQFRVEKSGIVHAGIGKSSFDEKSIVANINAFIKAVSIAKPSGSKGVYMKKITISSTMGPGVKIDTLGVMA